MTEFPENSAFELGRHKFISDEEFDRALKAPYERLAREVTATRVRRSLEDLMADVGEMEFGTEDENVRDMLSGIRRTVAEIISDLN